MPPPLMPPPLMLPPLMSPPLMPPPLKLPPPVASVAPYFGTVDIGVEVGARGYAEARAAIASELFTADPILLRCVRLVAEESFWLRTTTLIVSTSLETPYALDLFRRDLRAPEGPTTDAPHR